ncbi:cell division protein ZapE [Gordonia sp. DT30]|uniref:cell division protein ZapE n=1 Tax=Gordonia sp. DT30 TaxID=3416546 RepID=UPI003CE83CAE
MGLLPTRRVHRAVIDPEAFRRTAQDAGFFLDAAQLHAVDALSGTGNVYLVGPPGTGKTWLLDTCAAALPTGIVMRVHWHEFARDLHVLIREHHGLAGAVDHLLSGVGLLCFDELNVDDRADGIFVHRLLETAIRRGVRVVLSSNCRPPDLMPNPLMHHTFIPTIGLIETHCRVIELDAGTDYRTHAHHESGFASGRWIVTPPVSTEHAAESRPGVEVRLDGRSLLAWDAGPDHLGVRFGELCARPLGATDYLRLVRRHRSWTITEVPDLSSCEREPAQRFVYAIDVLYEHDAPVTIHSAVGRDEFGRRGAPPITGVARLLSRISALADGNALR